MWIALVAPTVYCVLTSASSSTWIWSLVWRAPTLSAGNSTLYHVSNATKRRHESNIREAFDQCEFVLDLATIVLGLLLCFVELIRRSVLFECDLFPLSFRSLSRVIETYVVERHGRAWCDSETTKRLPCVDSKKLLASVRESN